MREVPLSAKTVKDRSIEMAAKINAQQIDDITSAHAFWLACNKSSDVNDVEQCVSSDGPQEELVELVPLRGQTQGFDICEAGVSRLKEKAINSTHLV